MQNVASSLSRYIRPRDLAERLSLDRTTIWRQVKRGELPPPTQLSRGAIGWPEEQIAAILAERQRKVAA